MKLEIVSAQSEIDPSERFSEILKENGIDSENESTPYEHHMYYPEAQVVFGKHPKKIFEEVTQKVREHIENDIDYFILTSSEYVLCAARIEIVKHKFKCAKCRYMLNNGEEVCVNILEDGKVTDWYDEIFDMMGEGLYTLRKLQTKLWTKET